MRSYITIITIIIIVIIVIIIISILFFLILYAWLGEKVSASHTILCNPILFAICTSTFNKLCKNVYNGM
jgi:hypothetical protein